MFRVPRPVGHLAKLSQSTSGRLSIDNVFRAVMGCGNEKFVVEKSFISILCTFSMFTERRFVHFFKNKKINMACIIVVAAI